MKTKFICPAGGVSHGFCQNPGPDVVLRRKACQNHLMVSIKQAMAVLILLISGTAITNAQTFSISGNMNTCENQIDTFTASPNGNYNYLWGAVNGAVVNASGNTAHIQWANPPQGTVTLIVYDSLNTTILDTVGYDVDINYIPLPNIVPNKNQWCKTVTVEPGEGTNPDSLYFELDSAECNLVCEGDTIHYQAGSSTTGSVYDWLVQGSYSYAQSFGDYVAVVWDTIGYGSVTLTETNGAGCTGANTLCVEIIKRPTADFLQIKEADENDGVFLACVDNEIQFTNLSTGATYWEWDFGDDTNISLDQHPAHTYTDTGSYTVTLTAYNECGCAHTRTMRVHVIEAPELELYCISPVCPGDQSSYTIINNGSPSEACDEYEIAATNGNVQNYDPNFQTFDVHWDGDAGPLETITLKGDCFECELQFHIPVITSSVAISGDDIICQGQQAKYDVTLWPGTAYNWEINPSNAGTIITGQGDHEVVIDWSNSFSGNAQLKVGYEHPVLGSCSQGQGQLNIQVRPEYTVEGPEELCGDTVTEGFEIASNISGAGSFDFVVTQDQISTPVDTGSFSGPNFNLTFNGPGAYLVKVTETTGAYCEESFFFNVRVHPKPETPEVGAIAGETEVCPDLPFEYSYTATVPQPYYLRWATNDGTPATSGSNPNTITWNAGLPDLELYAVFVTKDDPECVSDTAVYAVAYKGIAPAAITGDDTVCNNSFKSYADLGEGYGFDWHISPNTAGAVNAGQGTSTVDIQWHNYVGPVSVFVNRKICDTTVIDTFHVELIDVPAVSIVSDDTVCQGGAVSFSTSPSGNTYNWDFGQWGTSTAANPSILYGDSGSFSVSVAVGFNGCQVASSDQKDIFVNPAPVVHISTADELYVCQDPTLYATLQGPGGGGVNVFQWYKQPGVPVGFGTSFSPSQEGVYYVVATNSTTLCTDTSNTLEVLDCTGAGPGPACGTDDTISYVIGNNICGQIDITADIGTGYVTKMKLFGAGTIFNDTLSHYVGEAGYYSVTIWAYVADTNGVDSCVIATTATAEVPLMADFTIGTQCGSGNEYDLSFINTSSFTIGNPITYTQWSSANMGVFSTSFDATQGFPAGTTDTVTLMVTNGDDTCYMSKVVDLPEKPVALFTPSTPACEGQTVTFSDLSTGSLVKYFWEYDDADTTQTYINGSSYFNYANSAFYNPSLTVYDQYGCSDIQDTSFFVNSNDFDVGFDMINPEGSIMACGNQCVDLDYVNGTFQTSLAYLWSNLATTSSIEACYSGAYLLTVTNATTGCMGRFGPTHVGFTHIPQAVILGDSIMCQEKTYRLLGNVGPDYDYEWFNSVGTPVGTNPNLDWWSGSTSGADHVDLVVSDPVSGCADTGRFHFSVNEGLSPTVTTTSPSPYCEGEDVVLNYSLGNPPAAGIQWSTGSTVAPIAANQPGPYLLTAFDDYGCESTDQFYIGHKPDIDNFLCGCYEACYQNGFEIPGVPGSYSYYAWLVDGNVAYSASGVVNPYSTSLLGTHEYQVVVEGAGGCYDTTCVAEVTLVNCQGGSPCDLIPCDPDCDLRVVHEVTGCAGYDASGNFTFNVNLGITLTGSNGYVFYVEDMMGNPINFQATSLISNTQANVPIVIAPQGNFPYCFNVYVFNNATGRLCKKKVCVEQGIDCEGDGKKGPDDRSETDSGNGMDIYPNPSHEALFVSFNGKKAPGKAEVEVYSATGRLVHIESSIAQSGLLKINTSQWPAGIYLVHVKTGTGLVQVRKITVVH